MFQRDPLNKRDPDSAAIDFSKNCVTL